MEATNLKPLKKREAGMRDGRWKRKRQKDISRRVRRDHREYTFFIAGDPAFVGTFGGPAVKKQSAANSSEAGGRLKVKIK
jgi:hypothetical protein